ncbi:C40 family peptidase [Cytobacillus oceanisediminis]|uniref:C40 family peptidase n=1 Tax=Cytobacillus oceanisediminis TaxID=665099 RepID=UPI0037366F6A
MYRRIILAIVSCFFLFSFQFQTIASAKEPVNYDQLIPLAKKYIGIPYQWGGTTPSGFDCSGYITFVYKQLDKNLPRTTSGMYSTGVSVKKSDLRVGDLVFFNTSGKGVSHAGIYIGDNNFVHASTSKGVMISSLNDPYYWKSRYIGARRVLDYRLGVGSYHDVNSSYWAHKEVKTLSENEIVLGYEKSYFMPEDKISRAEVAALLAEALGLNVADRKQQFKDVPSDHWAVGAINALYKEGIVKGDPNNNFSPESVLKREHLAIIFSNAFDLKAAGSAENFADVKASSPTYDPIQRLASSGIAKGYPDQTFKPRDDVKRSQYAAFLYRALY